jgi:FlgD Ig-like domain
MHVRKYRLLAVAFLATPLNAMATTPAHLWSQRFGDEAAQRGSCLSSDASGNVFISGQFEGTVDLGGDLLTSEGDHDIFLAKFDASGNHQWSHSFGGTDYDNAPSIAVDASGNVVMAGYFRSTLNLGGETFIATDGDWDLFLAKFDSNGNHLWSDSFGDGDTQLTFAVAVDASDNIIWTGHFYQTIDFGGGVLTSTSGHDMYLAKFDPNGNHIWSDSYSSTGSESSSQLAVDASGNVVVGGRFDGTVDFGGGLLTTAGGNDVYVVKFGPDGTHLWSHSFGDENFQQIGGLAVDPSESVVLTGSYLGAVDFGGGVLTSAGSYDIFLAKYNSSGDHVWSYRFGDTGTQHTHAVAFDASDNVVITGGFSGTVDFGGGPLTATGTPFSDIFLAKLDADGNHLWSERFGDAALDVAKTVALDPWDNILLSGRFRGSTDFGGGVLTSAGGDDVFLTKFASAATGIVNGPSMRIELSAYPNPFNPTTTIAYHIPKSGFAKLQIYDLKGRLVETLVESQRAMGDYAAAWDGRDDEGSAVASGVYFARLSFDGTLRTQKIVLLK